MLTFLLACQVEKTTEPGDDTGGGTTGDTGATDTDTDGTTFDGTTDTLEGWPDVSDAADVTLWSEKHDQAIGRVIAVGDLTGDGTPDLALGAPASDGIGGAWVLPGPITTSGSVQDLGWWCAGEVTSAPAATTLAVGDVDEDGQVDLGVGTSTHWLLWGGPIVGPTTLSGRGALAALAGEHPMGAHGDLTGDGVADVLVVEFTVWIAEGPVTGAARPESLLTTTAAAFSSGGDFDGDGFADVVVVGDGPGADITLVTGPFAAGAADAWATWETEGTAYTGAVAAADLDGDGHDDLVVTAPEYDGNGTDAGRVWIVTEPGAGGALADAPVILDGESPSAWAGTALAVAPLPDTGRDALLVGAEWDASAGVGAGAAWLFTELPGSGLVTEAPEGWMGPPQPSAAGAGVALADVDGDDAPEVLIGADAGEGGGGVVYVLHR